jgi:DNA-binding NarL/FixJ family response regulator
MKFLIVDDHALIRDAMRAVLTDLQPDSHVLEAARADEARTLLATRPEIDLLLLDLHLPDADGLDLLADCRDEHPATAVVVLSAASDTPTVRAALAAGASGFIPKSHGREVLARALALVIAGGVYVPPSILTEASGLPFGPRPVPGAPTPASLGLTTRQLEVLALVMRGRSNKLIARELNLAEPTVKNHVTALLRALRVRSRTEAVVTVTAWGWAMPAPARP